MNHKLKITLVLVLFFQNYIFSKQHKIQDINALVGGKGDPSIITAQLEIDSENGSIGDLTLYLKSGYQKTALAFNKEQRKVVMSHYNKFQEWQKVAIENKIKEHKKDVGVISDVVGFIYSVDSWETSYPVEINILAIIGDIAMLSFVVPKLTSKNNKYISAPLNLIGLPDNKDTEALGISTPKVIFEIFEEENLQNQANEILNQLDEKKKLDELFK